MWSQASGHSLTDRRNTSPGLFVIKAALAAFFLLLGLPARALGPHECVLLANRNSMGSVELAHFYADLRGIPGQNIIYLDLPGHVREATAVMAPEEFRSLIYEPVMKTLIERRLTSHALVWLYSLDFPTTISTAPPMSLTGMTFVRGNPPPAELIQNGHWPSPLFQGPDRPDGPAAASITLEQFAMRLGTNMPIPSMMLGWSGARGMTLEEIKQHLRTAAKSDAAHPDASVFFEVNDNVRSTTRQWQFEPATRELIATGVQASASSELPRSSLNTMGVMAGRATFDRAHYGALRPGAYADHLTSFGAIFHEYSQTKLTEWLRAGAAATAGTITEPGSLEVPVILWAKFPAARAFVHYARGCTMIESLYMATRSPLQILFVGDALCAPWSRPPGLTLINLADDPDAPLSGDAEFMGSFFQASPEPRLIVFFLNGHPIMFPDKPSLNIKIPTRQLADGYHSLRAVAYNYLGVRHQGFVEKGFIVNNRGRSISLGGYSQGQSVDLYHPVTFTVEAEGAPDHILITAHERILAQKPYEPGMRFEIHPMQSGAGPVRFQAVAMYGGKDAVRSAPLKLNIQPLNKPPAIGAINVSTNADNMLLASFKADDEDDNNLTGLWLVDLMKLPEGGISLPGNGSKYSIHPSGGIPLSTGSGQINLTARLDQPNQIRDLITRVRFMDPGAIEAGHVAGLVFNYTDDQNFIFWGCDGNLSAWSLIRMLDGRAENILTRGYPIETQRDYTLMITAISPQKLGLFVNHDLQATVDLGFGPGRAGIRYGTAPVQFESVLASPALAVRSFLREDRGTLSLALDDAEVLKAVHAGARDVQFTVTQPVLNP